MRHLGVVGVGVVNRVVFSLAYVSRKGFTVVVVAFWLFRLLGFPFGDEVGDPRVRAGGVVRRITQVQDVVVTTDRKPFDFTELWILKFLTQLLGKVGAAGFVIFKR